jgi:pimeloyl-ACP methyl ester carboxylesterase
MRYLRDGRGPELVLVHGLLGYSFSWRYTLPYLARQASVLAVDMLGVGFSDRPTGLDSSLRGSAERLLRFLDAVGVASCDLLGTSHGGAISMMAAALDPGRIRRLVLVAPVNPWSSQGKNLAALLGHRAVAPIVMRVAPRLKAIQPYLLRRLYGDPARIRPGTLEGYAGPFELPGAFRHELGILSTWDRDLRDLESMLPRISHIPSLLIWGDLDNAVLPHSAVPLRNNFHDCQVEIFPGVGHLPYEEVPDEFNRVVGDFLSRK